MFPGTWTRPASCPPARGEDTLHADPVGTVKYDGGKKLLGRNCADAMPLRGSELDPVLRDLEALFIVKDHCPLYVVPEGRTSLEGLEACSPPLPVP